MFYNISIVHISESVQNKKIWKCDLKNLQTTKKKDKNTNYMKLNLPWMIIMKALKYKYCLNFWTCQKNDMCNLQTQLLKVKSYKQLKLAVRHMPVLIKLNKKWCSCIWLCLKRNVQFIDQTCTTGQWKKAWKVANEWNWTFCQCQDQKYLQYL